VAFRTNKSLGSSTKVVIGTWEARFGVLFEVLTSVSSFDAGEISPSDVEESIDLVLGADCGSTELSSNPDGGECVGDQ
jgi:hypothetical protein